MENQNWPLLIFLVVVFSTVFIIYVKIHQRAVKLNEEADKKKKNDKLKNLPLSELKIKVELFREEYNFHSRAKVPKSLSHTEQNNKDKLEELKPQKEVLLKELERYKETKLSKENKKWITEQIKFFNEIKSN